MTPLVLDFETYFEPKYSIQQLGVSEYVRDKRFEIHGAAVMFPESDQPAAFYWKDTFESWVKQIDWANIRLVAHNAKFEAFILHTLWGIHPGEIFCTRDATNAIYQGAIRSNLDDVSRELGLPTKPFDIRIFKSFHAGEMGNALREKLEDRGIHDAHQCWNVYRQLLPQLPPAEIRLLDLTCKLFSVPRLEINTELVRESLDEEAQERDEIVARTSFDGRQLASDGFSDLLRLAGVEPPTKISPRTGKSAYAYAKTDVGMQKLLAHDDPNIRALAEARLAVKSTIGVTRAQRFITAGTTGDCKLPIWLNYYGAHTGRWSGGDKRNPQNLKRGGKLRRSIQAPKGYVLCVADSSQIEARDAAFIAGEQNALEDFRSDDKASEVAELTGQKATEDSYTRFAAKIFSHPVTKDDKEDRFVGKVAKLGLQYQMGGPHFQYTLASGIMGQKVFLPLATCIDTVTLYRHDNPNIKQLWKTCSDWLDWMTRSSATEQIDYRGILRIDPVKQAIWLPNGMPLLFPRLGWNAVEEQYEYWNGMFTTKLYGGKLLENIVQALARIQVADWMLEIDPLYPIVTMSHDEIVAMAPENEADTCLEFMFKTMRTPPAWCAGMPLNCEGGYDRSYSK